MTSKHEKGRTLDIDGAQIHVQRVEAKGRSEIVLLHGGLGTLEDFAAFVPHLPNAHVGVVPFGSHMMHAERPALVAPSIRAFLDEITAKKH